MKQEGYSIFGQADYKIGRLKPTAGGACMHDLKRAATNIVLLDKFSQ